MQLTPLGCVAGMPVDGEASSGYLVEHGDTAVLLDAGPGVALNLSRMRTAVSLSAVFISHQHSDHIFDLLPLGKMVMNARLETDERTGQLVLMEHIPRVPLLVPRGARRRLEQLAAIYPVTTHPLLDRAFDHAFDVREYEPGDGIELAGMSLRWELLAHVAPDCGVRIEAGETSLVYTGDTGVTPAIARLADGAGTLLSESTLRASDTTSHGHLSSTEAGRCAAEAGVTDLVLTHFSTTDPDDRAWHVDRAAGEFDGPVTAAAAFTPLPVRTSRKALA